MSPVFLFNFSKLHLCHFIFEFLQRVFFVILPQSYKKNVCFSIFMTYICNRKFRCGNFELETITNGDIYESRNFLQGDECLKYAFFQP